MPPLSRTLGLVLVAVCPALLAAQPVAPPSGWPQQPVGESTGAPSSAYDGGRTLLEYSAPIPPPQEPPQPSAAAPGVSLSPQGNTSPMPLAPPGQSGRTSDDNGGLPSVVTVAASLAIVLGVFFLVAWLFRRAAPAGSAPLPSEVFEVLGRAPMAGRQQIHLLRCGNVLLLVSVTPAGAETLAEITDPVEVDRLAGLCRQAQPNSATAAFRQVLGQFASPRPAGLLGRTRRDDVPPLGIRGSAGSGGLEGTDV